MKRTIYKSDLALIALIYNYIANKKTSLTGEEVTKFIINIEQALKFMPNKFEISYKDSEIPSIMHKDGPHNQYILKDLNLNSISCWYEQQPLEIISVTLHEKVLEAIDVDKDDLRIKKEYTEEYGTLGVYSLEHKRAVNSAVNILEGRGYENISIINARPTQLDADKGYKISYKGSRPYQTVNILTKKPNN